MILIIGRYNTKRAWRFARKYTTTREVVNASIMSDEKIALVDRVTVASDRGATCKLCSSRDHRLWQLK